jgi:YVTN family beta-propeller protein
MKRRIRKLPTLGGALALIGLPLAASAQNPLVNGKKITLPPVGKVTKTLPNPIILNGRIPNVGQNAMNMIASPNGKFAVVSDMGFRQYLSSVDTASGELVAQISYGAPYVSGSFGLFYGLVFNPTLNGDGTYTLYAAQGAFHTPVGTGAARTYSTTVAVVKVDASSGALTAVTPLTFNPVLATYDSVHNRYTDNNTDFTTGLALSADSRYLYVANGQASVANMPGSLIVVDSTTGTEVGRYNFPGVAIPAVPGFMGAGTNSNFPLAVVAAGNTVYVGSESDDHVYAINVSDPANPTRIAAIETGSHPIALLLNRAKDTLYVGNAHSDTISVIATAANAITHTVDLRPDGAKSLVGVTPTNFALSPDEKTLYVTLGDMDAVAMIDTASLKIRGEIPVGWYPSAVVATSDGKRILVSNARGTQPRYPNPGQLINKANVDNTQYTLNMIESDVETIKVPTLLQRLQYTQQVLANNKITPNTDNPAINPLWKISKANGGITHVFYIIRENRTYDQVLGDLNTPTQGSRGNGDPSLVLFGKDVTPNIHAIANRFVLLDNFYDCGDASMEGWAWSTGALSNEHIVKNQPYNYSSRGASYDSEGTVNSYPVAGFPADAVDQNNNPLPELPAIPDAGGNPAGHIWDTVLAAGGTVRDYGAMINAGYPAVAGFQPGGHYDGSSKFNPAVHGRADLDFSPYNNTYAESPAPNMFGFIQPTPTYGIYGATNRFDEWNREFQAMLANDPTGDSVPNFELVRFGRDHTQGLNYDHASPKAEVSDNDYAVGKFVETISHSPIWKHSAIFILEDDAQNGPDHVDSHRSIGFVISPYIKKGSYSSRFYNTNSFLHNIELLLNARPLSQYDAIADCVDAWDTAQNNDAPYAAILPAQSILTEVLSAGQYYTRLQKSEYRRMMALASKMDLVHADAADPDILNEMIWKSVKGIDAKMPAPTHSAFIEARIKQNAGTADGQTSKVAKSRKADDDDD